MERTSTAPDPIDMPELLAAVVAVAFGLFAGAGLVGALNGTPAAPAAGPVLVTQALAGDTCSNASRDPLAMRLGRLRAYPSPVSITLEPAPFSLQPPLAAEDAYRRSGQHLSGCETEELLAFYSSTSPTYDHALAWVLVSTLPCPGRGFTPAGADAATRQCISVSPIDATSGVLMGTRIFELPP